MSELRQFSIFVWAFTTLYFVVLSVLAFKIDNIIFWGLWLILVICWSWFSFDLLGGGDE